MDVRVILQAQTGHRAGHRIWLGANQRVVVGASDWGEFSGPDAARLGETQFVIESDFHCCRIRDPRASGAIRINGKPVREQTLVNGDIVTAGNVQFTVGIDNAARRGPDDAYETPRAPDQSPATQAAELTYDAERCESGLMRFSGAEGPAAAVAVARLLAEKQAMYLLVDPARAGWPPQTGCDDRSAGHRPVDAALPAESGPEHDVDETPPASPAADGPAIFDLLQQTRIPVAARQARSLLVFTPQDTADRIALLEQAWNRNAAVAVFSPCEPTAVLNDLKQTATWLCPPEVIGHHLSTCAPSHAPQILRGIKAVLLRTEQPGGWCVFASVENAPLWAQLGFPRAPGRPATRAG